MQEMEFIDNLSIKIREMMEKSPAGDIEKNLHALLQGIFTKLELVSREEFDVQAEVLRQARQKLESLEATLAVLEAKLQKNGKQTP